MRVVQGNGCRVVQHQDGRGDHGGRCPPRARELQVRRPRPHPHPAPRCTTAHVRLGPGGMAVRTWRGSCRPTRTSRSWPTKGTRSCEQSRSPSLRSGPPHCTPTTRPPWTASTYEKGRGRNGGQGRGWNGGQGRGWNGGQGRGWKGGEGRGWKGGQGRGWKGGEGRGWNGGQGRGWNGGEGRGWNGGQGRGWLTAPVGSRTETSYRRPLALPWPCPRPDLVMSPP